MGQVSSHDAFVGISLTSGVALIAAIVFGLYIDAAHTVDCLYKTVGAAGPLITLEICLGWL